MSAMEEILQQLRMRGVNSKMIKELIDDHRETRQRQIALFERYKGTKDGITIFERKFLDKNKINNKLANDFVGEIIDTKMGYMFGNPVIYAVDEETENSENINEKIQFFLMHSNIEDLDAETGKMTSITGQAVRLLYIDHDGNEAVIAIPPWQTIFLYETSINDPEFALRYYNIQLNGDTYTKAEWYDDQNVTFFLSKDGGDFILDLLTEEMNPRPHMFDEVPLVAFPNNEEQIGDVERVLTLIDAYDRTLSDVNSEIEQFRLAYMAFSGLEIDEETLENAKRTGAFGIPNADASVSFITKMMDDSIVEHHLDRLENNIFNFAKHVNFGDEQFAGNQSGVSLRFKLFSLETKSIVLERKFTAALRRQFKVLSTSWAKRGINLDYHDVIFTWTRNLPVNIQDEADSTQKLKGLVSEEIRLGLLSFIDDPKAEMERMEREQSERIDLDQELPPIEDEEDGDR